MSMGRKYHIPQNTMITVYVLFSLILLRLLVEVKLVCNFQIVVDHLSYILLELLWQF